MSEKVVFDPLLGEIEMDPVVPDRHNLTSARDEADAHPIAAITGLQDALDALGSSGGPAPVTAYETAGVPVFGELNAIWPKAGAISYVRLVGNGALPVGGNFEIDVQKNGTTILSENAAITPTHTASNGGYISTVAITPGTYADGDKLAIVAVAGSGNTFAGSSYRVEIGYANS